MTVHLIKLCVGVSEVDELVRWVAECKRGRDTLEHVTRMYPKREAEIVPGGSLFWVIRGTVLCRQPIARLEAVTGDDGISRCRIVFKPEIILVRPTPRRAFQGWRYLDAADAPPDMIRRKGEDALPEDMARDLAALGLL
jgi:hypothetical protein